MRVQGTEQFSPDEQARLLETLEKAEALADMMRTEGWKVFCAELEVHLKAAQRSLYTAPDAHTMARLVGKAATLEFVRGLPEAIVNAAQLAKDSGNGA